MGFVLLLVVGIVASTWQAMRATFLFAPVPAAAWTLVAVMEETTETPSP